MIILNYYAALVLLLQVRETFGYVSFAFQLYKDKSHQLPVVSSPSKSLSAAGISHGDLIFLTPVEGADLTPDSMEIPESMGESSLRARTSSSSTSLKGSFVNSLEKHVGFLYRGSGFQH